MNRKHLVFAFAICLIASMLLGQTAFAASNNKCGGDSHYGIGAPTNLKLDDKTDTTANIEWTAPRNTHGIAGYNVYRDNVLVGSTTDTNFGDAGLTPNTYYTWTVKAFDASKRLSDPSNRLTTATPIIIRDEVTWDTGAAPEFINGGLIVETTGYLKIEPGVILKIKPSQSVMVYGTVNAAGSADAMIVFTSSGDKAFCGSGQRCGSGDGTDSNGCWNTILIAGGGSFTGDYVKVTYANTLATVQGMLILTNSEAAFAKTMGIFVDASGEFDGINDKIHDCCTASRCRGIDTKGLVNLTSSEIYDCPGTGVLIESTGSFNGTSVNIHGCDKGVEIRGSINFVTCSVSSCHYGLYFNTTTSNGVIMNSFMGNDKYGVYNAKPDDVTIDASMNYWGSANGPSVYDEATKTWSDGGDRVSKGVLFDNWLTEPVQ